MKKLLCILFFLALISSSVAGCFYIRLRPKAAPLTYPALEQIRKMTVVKNRSTDPVTITEQDAAALLSSLASTEPTRRQSLNDSPAVTPYYRLTLVTEERTYIYYLYEDDGVTYLESPYEGIYRIEKSALSHLAAYQ